MVNGTGQAMGFFYMYECTSNDGTDGEEVLFLLERLPAPKASLPLCLPPTHIYVCLGIPRNVRND